MNECIFCKIASGKIPCSKIYEDGNFLAFLDIRPINKGHTMVIPKKHFENIFEMPEKLVSEYILLVHKLGPKIKEAMKARWINLLVFGEEVKHTHLHIVPRFDNDNFAYPKQGQYAENEEKATAEKIRKLLK